MVKYTSSLQTPIICIVISFFFFALGFGFPLLVLIAEDSDKPFMQIVSLTEWIPVMLMLLGSKCTIFVTRFFLADVERDVKSLSEVAGEFDWVITPG